MAQNKTRVVVAGGGTAGWLTAFSLVTRLGNVLDITLVESDQIGTVGVGEATIPTMCNFHRLMGIDEREFMAATNATFKLGIQFNNWANQGDSYIHSFGEIGQRSWMAEFHEFWMEAVANGQQDSLDEYCLELKAARQNKFATKVGNKALNFAYHLDATAYAGYLRAKSEAAGVKRCEGKIKTVDIDPQSGNLTGLGLDSDLYIKGDVFIDCTGFRGLLISEHLDVGYEDWSHWLAADRAIAVQTASVEPAKPYTIATAHKAGWQWRIPLQSRVGNGIVYSSQFLSDEEALATLKSNLQGEILTEPRYLKFKTGRRQKAWHKNCIAIGLASGFLEPLESTSIHLVTTALIRLMKLFPFTAEHELLAEQYNRETQKELETIRDFIVLHYHLTQRDDSDFWNHYRTMEIPEPLAHRMAIFAQNGYVWPDDVSLFRVDSWVQVMMGQGLRPAQHHGASRMLPTANLQQQLAAFKQSINSVLNQLPSHSEFIAQYCPANEQVKQG
ncbi:tryptophan halogenase family protein [Alteromonas lipolytica]|uniref:Tryptophan halogenase n=1 Tax=Alteromonas lipolytica TaxID=1856405 RepID=A0A1E8FJN4_9ALTE|nr:tryptophan halogenase family protein [Alteromonas lipolytica]OFI35828.1 tryptophan halogenase [Alteromonas lipolytica]GGF81180.1 tryptophan halogenase [Alteromonas lipolytica]